MLNSPLIFVVAAFWVFMLYVLWTIAQSLKGMDASF
jgi:hypothetical protein